MGTASPSQRAKRSSEQSSGSSPSSEDSNQSSQQRNLQVQWLHLGLPDANSPAPQTTILSPAHPSGLFTIENLGVSSLHSPYTPNVPLTELPGAPMPYNMASHVYSQAPGRYGYPPRSASTGGLHQSPPSTAALMLPQGYPHSAPAMNGTGRMGSFSVMSNDTPSPPTLYAAPMDEPEKLKRLVHELQQYSQELQLRIEHLESELTATRVAHASGLVSPAESARGGFSLHNTPNLMHGQTPAQLDGSWRRRTEARIRKFCSPNRAGNALCAWHDTRRERRAYPPRMAPPNTLNCGCTVAEALFEESLSRHGVGSYLPGDSVRMDPALRNPLLRLLEKRYGYRDGDFERDPMTGAWADGEGPERWEAELQRHGSKCHR